MQFHTGLPSVRRATVLFVLIVLWSALSPSALWGQGVPGSEKWRFKTGGDIFGAPALSPDSQTIYVGSLDGSLYAVEAANGRLLWSYAARLSTDNSIRSSPAVTPDGTILFGSGDWLYALNPNGTLKWTNTTYAFDISISGSVYSSPAITAEGRVVVAGAENRRIFVFDSRNGSLIRSNFFSANFISSAAVGVDDSVFIGGLDGNLYALTSTLTSRWSGRTTLGISGGPAIGPDGTIYTGSADNNLYAFGPGGSRLWAFETGDAIFAAPVVGVDGTVYVGSWDNKFYAVNPNGTLKWSFGAEGLVHGSAALAADGTIYVPTDVGSAGRLVALNAQGAKLWEFNSGEQIHASPLIGPDGTVYVGSFDDHLFAIRGTSGPAVSSWPMSARTVARPGRVNAQVAITSPRSGRVITSPARVVVDATISLAPGGVAQSLELYLGSSLVGRQSLVRPGGLVTFDPITIVETNRHQLQVRASVRNLDGTQDVVSSPPAFISVIQNRNGPVLSVIPDVETSKQAQIPFSASDVETPPEELFFVVDSQSSVIPTQNVQIQGTSTNRIMIINPVVSGAVPAAGIVVPLSLTVYDGELGDPATRSAKRDFKVKVLPPTTPPVILLGSPVPPGSNRLLIREDPIGGPVRVIVNVADEEDAFESLGLSFVTLDPELIPSANVTLGGAGFERFIQFLPATNQSGLARLALTVRDTSGETATTNLVVSIAPQNDAPVISRIENVTLNDSETSRRIFFSIRDVDTPSTLVSVRAISSNTALLPLANITFEGTSESRSLTLRPVSGQSGTATISLIATDNSSIPPIGSAPSSFTVTVLRANTPPVISPIPQLTTFEDTPIIPVNFTVSDAESPTSALTVTAVATNEVLVPSANIRIDGTGGTRTLSLVPATNLFGTNLIVVTVSDPQGGTNRAFFQLVVTPLNDSPRISSIADVVVDEDGVSAPLTFTIGDVDTAAGVLTLSASSSNPGLVAPSGVTFASIDGTQRTIVVRPVADASGIATLTVTVSDGEGSSSTNLLVTVNPVNDAPSLVAPASPLNFEGNRTSVLPPVVGGDIDAGAGSLRMTIAASPGRLQLVTTGGLTFESGTDNSGSFQVRGTLVDLNAAMRAMRFTPPDGHIGLASISMVLSDLGNTGSGGSKNASSAISINVTAGNSPPTISSIGEVRIDKNGISAPIGFMVGDAETSPERLGITLSSSNPTLMPSTRIELQGDGANRFLVLIPARDRTGNSTIEITVADEQGATATTQFLVTVETLNAPPVLALPPIIRTIEDAAGGTGPIAFLATDSETPVASLVLTVVSADTNLLAASGIALGGSGTNRTLTLNPRPDQFGTTTVSVVLSDGLLSVTNVVRFEVVASNDRPRFRRGPDITVRQNAGAQEFLSWATDLSAGPANESAQKLSFTVAAADESFFAVLPSIDAEGTLRFTVAADRSGSSGVLVRLKDDGGTADGGVDLSEPALLEIAVLGVNQAPSFVKGLDVAVLEDSGPALFSNWATEIKMGSPAETGQTGAFEVSSSNAELFEVLPSISPDGALRFTPARNAFGTATFTVRLRDDGGTANGGVDVSEEVSAVITVKAVNDSPTLDVIPDLTIDEDSGETGIELRNVGFGALNEGQVLTVTAVSANRDLLPDPRVRTSGFGNTVLLLLPRTNAVGSSAVTVTVRDDGGVENGGVDSITRTFVLTVLAINDPPTISPVADQVVEQGKSAGPIPVAISDPDTALTNLLITASSDNVALVPASAVRVAGTGPTRILTVTPAPGVAGTAVVTLQVTDGESSSQTSFKVTVFNVNRPPVIGELVDTTIQEDDQGAEIRFGVSDADTAPEALVVDAISSDETLLPAAGIQVARASNNAGETNFVVRLTPAPDRSGSLKLKVNVFDGVARVSKEIGVVVAPVNDAPSFVAGPDVSVAEDAVAQRISGWARSLEKGPVDESSQTLRFEVRATSPDLFSTPPAIAPDGTLTYVPAPNAFGASSVTVVLIDDGGVAGGGVDRSPARVFNLRIEGVNDAPTLNTVNNLTRDEDSGAFTLTLTGISSGASNEAQQLILSAKSSDPAILPDPVVNYSSPSDIGRLVLNPATNANGNVTVTVTVRDDGGTLSRGVDTVVRTFTVNFLPVNDPPVIAPILPQSTQENTATAPIRIAISDIDTPVERLTVSTSSGNQELLPDANLSLSGTGALRTLIANPARDRTGESIVTVVVSDGEVSATNRFTIIVNAVNQPPVLGLPGNQTVLEDTPLLMPFLASDRETSAVLVRIQSSNQALFPDGNLQLSGTGTNRLLRAQPALNAHGDATLTLVADDGRVSVTNAVNVRVLAVNDAPTFNPINNLTREEDSGVFTLVISGITSGAANETQRLSVTAVSSTPGLLADPVMTYTSPSEIGRLILTPLANAHGKTEVTVTVRDDGGRENGGIDQVQQTFTLTIEPVNDAPTLAPLGSITVAENGTSAPIRLVVGDIDTPLAQLKLGATSSDPALVTDAGLVLNGISEERNLVISPVAGRTGTALISVSVNDGTLSASQSFTLTVISVNEAPRIAPIGDQRTDEDVALNVALTVTDRENDVVQLSVESSNPALLPLTNVVLSGAGPERLLRLTPLPNQNGETVIRLVAGDGRLSSTNEFKFIVRPVDDPPSLGAVPSQAINQDSTSSAIPLVIEDADTPLANLTFQTSSSNPVLLPETGLIVGGDSGRRTLTITPTRGQSGEGRVTLRVSDAFSSAEQSFLVVVSAPNTPPSILVQPQGRTVLVGTTVSFGVTAAGTAPLQYQWSVNGTNIASATNAVLSLSGVGTSATGRYVVRVQNTAGVATSEAAVLIVGQLGSKLWDTTTAGQVRSSAALGPDGTVYVGSDDGNVYAYTPFGQKLWGYATGGPVISSPMVSGGVVYVGSQDGGLHAIGTNGVRRWRFEAGAAIDSSPAQSRDGTIYFGCNNNKLYAVRPDGTERWSVTAGGLIYSSPAVSQEGNIYFGAYDNRLYAVDAEGNPLWQFSTGGVVASSPAIGSDGTVYFGSADKRLYALRPDGTRRWQYVSSAAISGSPVVGADGQVFVGTEDGRLVALTAEGTRRWEFLTGGPIYGAPTLGNDGTVYVASFDSKIYALNANGTKRWEFATGGPLYCSPALDREGVLYLGSFDAKVYAIRGTTGLADLPWAMFHREATHQGRVPSTAVEPLRIRTANLLLSGGLELQINGPAGANVVVEVSSDLVTWTRIDSVNLPQGGTVYRDTRPAQRQMFYRLQSAR